jgi:flagellin
LSTEQRDALQSSFEELQTQLTTTADNATLFGQNLLKSSATDLDIQSGINAGDTYSLRATSSDAATLGVDAATIDLTDVANSQAAMTALNTASSTVGTNQSTIGTMMTGLSKMLDNAKTMKNSLAESISKIEDADVAELSSQLTMLQSKQQLMSSTLGITNQFPQYLLSLIR